MTHNGLVVLLILGLLAACTDEASVAPSAKPSDDLVRLGPEALRTARLSFERAGPARLRPLLSYQGDLELAPDRRAKVVARVPGTVLRVRPRVGDRVARGEVLAVVDSRELGEAAAALLEATHRLGFAREALSREEQLLEKGISPRERYLKRKRDVGQRELERLTARSRLQALGVSDALVRSLPRRRGRLSRLTIRAPVAGTVVSRDVVVGQAVAGAAELFEVADLSELVVRFAVRTGDLAGLREGAAVAVRSPELGREGQARLSLLSPLVSRATRTVEVIASLPNAEGAWRPGLGVTVEVRAIPRRVALAVPRVAVHESAGKSLVFVRRSAGVFEARNVESGLADGERVEIRSGLEPGAEVAARNSLVLKSAWLTGGGE